MALVGGGDLVVRAIRQEGVDTIFISAPALCRAFYDWNKQVHGHHVDGRSKWRSKLGPTR